MCWHLTFGLCGDKHAAHWFTPVCFLIQPRTAVLPTVDWTLTSITSHENVPDRVGYGQCDGGISQLSELTSSGELALGLLGVGRCSDPQYKMA